MPYPVPFQYVHLYFVLFAIKNCSLVYYYKKSVPPSPWNILSKLYWKINNKGQEFYSRGKSSEIHFLPLMFFEIIYLC